MVIGKHKNIRNKNKCHSTPSEPCSLTTASRGYTNKPTKQDSDLKPHLINIREDFKKDTNNSLKELQEEKGKQIEALKKETHTSFKEIQENTINQVKELNNAIQDLQMEIKK